MGCGGSTESAETKEINERIKEDKKRLMREIKLLLLGAGESGKSTIAKQMKIIHLHGFDTEELTAYKPIVQSNVVECTRILVQAAIDLDMEIENESLANEYAEMDAIDTLLEKSMAADILTLWKDTGIQAAYAQRAKLQLPDSAKYVITNVDRISEASYMPTPDDVLRCRARTTGIHEIEFDVGKMHFRMVDVGGQRSERKKWVHCFQDVTAILFVVAMNAYDMKLYEDENVNRMHEAIQLFDEICNSKWFRNTAMVLFLNKSDLFKEKIEHVDLNVCFADYKGGKDYHNACGYLKEKFGALNRQPTKRIYTHITCATDTENIRYVFTAAKDIILSFSLGTAGF